MKYCLLVSLIFSSIGFAQKSDHLQTKELLEQAKNAYENHQFVNAISIIEDALPYFNGATKFEAYKYLALSYVAIGDKISAINNFKIALKLNHKMVLDSTEISAEVIQVINMAKKEIAQEAAMCSCFLPGYGQMIKGEDKKGQFIIFGAGISFVSSVILWLITENKHNEYLSLGPDEIEKMDAAYNTYNQWFKLSTSSSIVFIGIYIYSFCDAMFKNTNYQSALKTEIDFNRTTDREYFRIGFQANF